MVPARRATPLPAHTRPWSLLALLVVAGVSLAITDALMLRRYPLPDFVPGDGVAVGIREINGAAWQDGFRWLAAVGVLQTALYVLALVAASAAPLVWARRLAFAFPAVFAVLLFALYPIYATDLFHYLASARVYWVFGDNALTTPPSAYPFDLGIPFFDLPSPYGPLWTLLAAPAALARNGAPLMGALVLKGLAAAAFAGCTVLVYLLVRRLDPERPRRAVVAVVAFAWNPFVVMRMVGQGHNDSVMLCFLLLAFFLLVRGWWVGVLPALTAAVLVKYVAALAVLPMLIYGLQLARGREQRRHLWLLGFGGLHALLLAGMVWAPFWDGANSFALLRERGDMYTSTPGLLAFQFAHWPLLPAPASWGRALGLAAGLIAIALVLRRQWRGPAGAPRMVAATLLSFAALLLLASPVVRPWYFLWPVALAPLLPGRGPLLVATVLSASMTFPDLVEQYWDQLPWIRESFGRMLAAPVVVQSLPLALCIVALLLRTRSLTLSRAPVPTELVLTSVEPSPDSARATTVPSLLTQES